jgi:hypothetical protein
MPIELTEEQQKLLREREAGAMEVVDPQTGRAFVLLAREQYERVRGVLEPVAGPETGPVVPEGIRRSQQAMRRDLPGLLEHRHLRGQWVAYHGSTRIGIARDPTRLRSECIRRGLADDQYYIGWIDPSELIEEEELELPRPEVEEDAGTPTA